MKRFYLIIIGFLIINITAIAQMTEERAKIVQVCLDLPELQQYYPMDIQSNIKQVYIMQYPVTFSADLSLSGSDKEIFFMTMSEIKENKVEAYFMFRNIETTHNSSKVICHYFYDFNYDNNKSKYVAITIILQKADLEWSVVNTDVKGDSL